MKISDDHLLRACQFSAQEVAMKIDRQIQKECPCCGNTIVFPEAVVSSDSEKLLQYTVDELNEFISTLMEAGIEYYGEDVTKRFMVDKMIEMKKRFLSPELRVVE